VVRGGHWFSVKPGAQTAYREFHEPNKAAAQLGLRLVRVRSHEFVNDIGMQFIHVPAGKSWVHGGGGKPGKRANTVVADFFLGKFEVTQSQWQAIMGNNPSRHSRRHPTKMSYFTDAQLGQLPVENVSWNDCQIFLEKLNERCPEPGWTYRLPTWGEWEFAARGGPLLHQAESAFHYYAGVPTNVLGKDDANFAATGKGVPMPVGFGLPNRLRLYDMHGNVWEWTHDVTPDKNRYSIRGGAFNDDAANCAVNIGNAQAPTFVGPAVGLRVARVRRVASDAED
jgi:formylglycine-generating enzyme required for sulfatase activity